MNNFHIRRGAALSLSLILLGSGARARPGDLNNDLRVNRDDVGYALAAAGGLWAPPAVTSGDVAGMPDNAPDGRISLADAVRILRAVNGLDTLPSPPLSAPVSDSVTLSTDLSRIYQLPRAWWIQGTVTDSAGNPIRSADPLVDVSATIEFAGPNSIAAFSENPVSLNTGAFVAPVETGANAVSVVTETLEHDANFRILADYRIPMPAIPATISASADATQNFTRPDPPLPGAVSGVISGADWNIFSPSMILDNGGSASVVLVGNVSPLTYTLKSGPGVGTFFLPAYAMAGSVETDLSASLVGAPVTVTSGAATEHTITLPALPTLQGGIASGTVKPTWIGVYVETADHSILRAYSDADATGAYKLRTPAGPVSLMLGAAGPAPPGGRADLFYVQPATVPSGGGTQNFTMPSLPALWRFSGVVTRPDGAPLAGASVALAPVLTPAEVGTGWSGSGEALTGADGKFSIALPAASYRVTILPPGGEAPPRAGALRRGAAAFDRTGVRRPAAGSARDAGDRRILQGTTE
jgi:hypothetical protein